MKIVEVCSVCDEETRETRAVTHAELARYLATAANHGAEDADPLRGYPVAPYFNGLEHPRCNGRCCQARHDVLMHNSLFLNRVCLGRAADGTRYLSEIEVIDGG